MLPCFLGGRLSSLRPQHVQGPDEPGPGLLRLDHLVDEAPLGGDVGVGEAVLVVGDQLGPAGFGVGGVGRSRGGG